SQYFRRPYRVPIATSGSMNAAPARIGVVTIHWAFRISRSTFQAPWRPAHLTPLQSSGNGNQGTYLTEISQDFAEVLTGLIGAEAQMTFGFPTRALRDELRQEIRAHRVL
ncbi:MAG TPA: hypothetical protein VFN62_10405, partial [Acidobacteriaceae bacterium]|nr:hypothetical protein [Acidobacteriaceae bacterium]